MPKRQTLEALSGMLLAMFTAFLSATIVSTALPVIVVALHGSQHQYTWVVTATLLSSTASTPIWGKLADLFDKKLLVQLSIVIYIGARCSPGSPRRWRSSSPGGRSRGWASAACRH
jgi:MFS family permease